MSNAHTRGPWKRADYIIWPPNGGNAQFPVHAPKRGRIALALNREADARLIAAAPELLEALQECLAVVVELEKKASVWRVIGDKARAAVAKATGETNGL